MEHVKAIVIMMAAFSTEELVMRMFVISAIHIVKLAMDITNIIV